MVTGGVGVAVGVAVAVGVGVAQEVTTKVPVLLPEPMKPFPVTVKVVVPTGVVPQVVWMVSDESLPAPPHPPVIVGLKVPVAPAGNPAIVYWMKPKLLIPKQLTV